MRDLGMTDLTPVRLVAMSILELDERYLRSLQGQRYDDDLIYKRLGRWNDGWRRNRHNDEYFDAMRDIVRELTRR
jgi:allantoicase